MGKYSIRGSAEFDAKIDADLACITAAAAPHSLAGILLGGYGRGEGTPFIQPDGTQVPFNDYDLVVVVDELNDAVRNTFKTLEQQLTAELGLPVDLYPYARNHLPHCEFSMLNYEMKHGHMVVWGDEHMLDAMPDYAHDSIPLHEGSRLMLNRGKLLLDIKLRLAQPEPLTEEEHIRFIKFIQKVWLALGDCALLAGGMYDISYQTKRARIESIGDLPHRDTVIPQYLDAIDLKEWGDYHTRLIDSDIPETFRQARKVYVELFAWYRKRFSARECPIFKAMLLNLKWNRWPYCSHPRKRLYEALPELLNDEPDAVAVGQALCCSRNLEERFYKLQARFS